MVGLPIRVGSTGKNMDKCVWGELSEVWGGGYNPQ